LKNAVVVVRCEGAILGGGEARYPGSFDDDEYLYSLLGGELPNSFCKAEENRDSLFGGDTPSSLNKAPAYLLLGGETPDSLCEADEYLDSLFGGETYNSFCEAECSSPLCRAGELSFGDPDDSVDDRGAIGSSNCIASPAGFQRHI
jgi:hypothetical protein